MQNWHWFALGCGVGYVLARRSGAAGAGFGFNLSAGVRGGAAAQGGDADFLASGAGMTPLDEPHGSMPYAEIGTWDPQLPGGFPTYPDPGDAVLDVDGGPIQ